jgi:hypothetical protein
LNGVYDGSPEMNRIVRHRVFKPSHDNNNEEIKSNNIDNWRQVILMKEGQVQLRFLI